MSSIDFGLVSSILCKQVIFAPYFRSQIQAGSGSVDLMAHNGR
jgi:hypothetical protein